MATFSPYLNFDGDCAEAFAFYQSVIGGEIFSMDADQMPAEDAAEMGPEWEGRVIHTAIMVGDGVLMGSDIPPDGNHIKGNNSYVSYSVDDPAEAERVFAGLSEGGEIEMDMEETFWALRFGSFTDRFGVMWMVSADKPMEG